MPLPKPNKGEKEQQFIQRCMSNPTMLKEYPDPKQRSGVCYTQWKQKNTKDFFIPLKSNDGDILFIEENEGYADIIMFGEVGNEIDGNEIAKIIRELDNNNKIKIINERINSGGGSVINGLSVVSANLNSNKEIHTFNDGVAASMAGIILMTGEKIHAADYSQLMIHEPSIGGETIETTRDPKEKEGLIHIRDSLAKIIMNRTGKTKNQVDKIMNEETWYNAKEAKQEGFIDKIFITKQENVKATLSNGNKDGSIWDIVIINSGYADTQTGKIYLPPEVLKESISLFEGIDVYMHQFGETNGRLNTQHRPIGMDTNSLFGNKTGYVKDVIAEDRNGTIIAKGKYHVINPVVRETLLSIWQDDRSKMPEFSIDADFESVRVGDIAHVKKFVKANTLDIVTEGAFNEAGFLRLAASKNKENEMLDNIITALLAMVKAGTFKIEGDIKDKSDEEIKNMIKDSLGLKTDKEDEIEKAINKALTDDKVKDILGLNKLDEIKEAIEKLKNGDGDDDDNDDSDTNDDDNTDDDTDNDSTDDDSDDDTSSDDDKDKDADAKIKKVMNDLENMKKQASEAMVDGVLASDTTLNEATKDMIRNQFKNKVVEKETVQAAIKQHKTYLDKILASSQVNGHPITVGEKGEHTKLEKLLAVFVDPGLNEDHTDAEGNKVEGYHIPYNEQFRTLQDVLRAFAGHMNFQGVQTMQAASTTANFTTVFQDVMNKQIRKQYGFASVDAAWKKLTNETSFDTLDDQHIYDIGDLGLVADVAEGGTYTEFTRPTDVEATYTPKKIGNTLVISEEMLYTSGQKVTALIRQFPRKMAAAAVATLSKYVFDLITGCDSSSGVNSQTIYDTLVLYHGQHSNITASALSFSTYSGAYTAMKNQIKRSSVFPAEITPRYLLVPTELRETAHVILKNSSYARVDDASTGVAAVGNPFNFDGVDPLVVPRYYLCNDANNWYLIADKAKNPTLQIGYFQNQRVPQMFLQNDPTVAAVFTADQWTWKVKWRFGGAVEDWRSFYGGIVS